MGQLLRWRKIRVCRGSTWRSLGCSDTARVVWPAHPEVDNMTDNRKCSRCEHAETLHDFMGDCRALDHRTKTGLCLCGERDRGES